jgi:uncharacterized protein
VEQAPHLPYAAQIDAYGNGGFRFAGMSHRGSLLCLPNGVWASDVKAIADVDEQALAPLLARANTVKHLLVGTGVRSAFLTPAQQSGLRAHDISIECMTTGAAVRTYNIMVAEGRPVAALLIAVD